MACIVNYNLVSHRVTSTTESRNHDSSGVTADLFLSDLKGECVSHKVLKVWVICLIKILIENFKLKY